MVSTSVDDLRSSLQCARASGAPDPEWRALLTAARDMAASLGRKTMVKVLESEIRKGDRG